MKSSSDGVGMSESETSKNNAESNGQEQLSSDVSPETAPSSSVSVSSFPPLFPEEECKSFDSEKVGPVVSTNISKTCLSNQVIPLPSDSCSSIMSDEPLPTQKSRQEIPLHSDSFSSIMSDGSCPTQKSASKGSGVVSIASGHVVVSALVSEIAICHEDPRDDKGNIITKGLNDGSINNNNNPKELGLTKQDDSDSADNVVAFPMKSVLWSEDFEKIILKISTPNPVVKCHLASLDDLSVSFQLSRRDPLKADPSDLDRLEFSLPLRASIFPVGDSPPSSCFHAKDHSVKIRLAKKDRALWGRLFSARATPPFLAFDPSSVDEEDDDGYDDSKDHKDFEYEKKHPFIVFRAQEAETWRRKMVPQRVLAGAPPDEESEKHISRALLGVLEEDEGESEEESEDEEVIRIEEHVKGAQGCGGNIVTDDGILTKNTGRRQAPSFSC